ncbi:MAG: hypothetical protein HYU69_03325 [Bacteroidetes bacterium]|nr:hypothetical protein [Bacteroidota bacterium]
MDKNQIRKDIENLIANIKEHFDNALDHDHIPQLELETIVNKIEKLHQKAIILHFLNEKSHDGARDHKTPAADPETSATPNVQTDLFGAAISPKPVMQVAQKAEKITDKKVDAIADIHTAIGINEKFQFINELFEGITNEYTAAVNQLNNYTSFTEAESFLNSIKEIYKWKDDDLVVEKFMNIVKRKLK